MMSVVYGPDLASPATRLVYYVSLSNCIYVKSTLLFNILSCTCTTCLLPSCRLNSLLFYISETKTII